MSNEEMTLWLRELLVQGGIAASSIWNVGMHSPKATLLSWCAKFGLDKETRKDLGGHVQSSDASVAAYSRDMLAGPLRKLGEVLEAIRNGVFLPDATRAGAWKKQKKVTKEEEDDDKPTYSPTSPANPQTTNQGGFEVIQDSPLSEPRSPTWVPRYGDDESRLGDWSDLDLADKSEQGERTVVAEGSSEEEPGDDHELKDEDDDELVFADLGDVDLAAECEDAVNLVVEPPETGDKPGIPKGGIWKHASRGTLHLHGALLGRSEDRLICCRAITKVYEKLEAWPDEASGKCKMCFGQLNIA